MWRVIACVGLAGLMATAALADEARIYTDDGVAISGAEWHFATVEHRAMFARNPASYAPKYGGWCAWAAAQDRATASSPQAWRVLDGELYMNYNQAIQRRWETDIEGFIVEANRNWPDIF